MADQISSAEPAHSVRTWKIGVYFILVALFAALNIELFRELARTSYLEGFTKVSDLLSSAFDVEKRWDDIIVTLFSLMMAFILTVPVGWTYILTKEEEGIDPSLAQTLVVLGLVVCGVMMLLQDNLARAFGLVGVVAAVRYRNTLRDAKDAVYVFLAIGVGMGCGFRSYHVAMLLSMTVCGVFLLLWKFRIGRIEQATGLIRPFLPSGADKDGKKKKKESSVSSGALEIMSAEVRERVLKEFELQSRLSHLATLLEDKEKGIKRPNAALIIHATHPAEAQQCIHPVLNESGAWHLANITSSNSAATFEYLGRIAKKEPLLPSSLIEKIQTQCQPYIAAIEFRSLKGMKKLEPESTSKGEADPIDPQQSHES